MAASREASKSAGDWPGAVGAATFAIALSSSAIRDLSLLCMSAPPPAGSCRQRSSAHPHLPFFDDPSVRGDELKTVGQRVQDELRAVPSSERESGASEYS